MGHILSPRKCLFFLNSHERNSTYLLGNPTLTLRIKKIFFLILFYFLNYRSMITHLQETWKTQNKITYGYTIYYNYFFK